MNEQPSEKPDDIQKDFEQVFVMATGIDMDAFKAEYLVQLAADRLITGNKDSMWMEHCVEKARELNVSQHMQGALQSIYRRWVQVANRPKPVKAYPIYGMNVMRPNGGMLTLPPNPTEGDVFMDQTDFSVFVFAAGNWHKIPREDAMQMAAKGDI